MSTNYFLAILASAALLLAGCSKKNVPTTDPSKDIPVITDPSKDESADPSENPSTDPVSDDPGAGTEEKITAADFVGRWGYGEESIFTFNEDGTFTQPSFIDGMGTLSGTWSYNEADGILSLTLDDTGPDEIKVILIGGKAWMVFIFTSSESKNRNFGCYRKLGASVESGILGDGRWDSPLDGVKPDTYAEDVYYSMILLVSGTKIDVYVPSIGYHIQGTFALSDGHLRIETDDDHIWAAKIIDKTASDGSIYWNSWTSGGRTLNPETFELQSPYQWYSVNDLKKMGKMAGPEDDPNDFELKLWVEGSNLHEAAMQFVADRDFCVTPEGDEAYLAPMNWFYKR